MSISRRIFTLVDQLDRLGNPAALAETTGRLTRNKGIEKRLAIIEREVTALAEDLTAPESPAPSMSSRDRNISAVAAFVSWARTCGAAIVRFDSAHRMIVTHCPEADRPFWAAQPPELIAGLVAHEIAPALEAEGVYAWRANPDDGLIRVVDQNRLTAHGDIRRWVDPVNWPGGRRCRCCGIEEPPTGMQLVTVDPEKRNTFTRINDVFQICPGVIYAHEKCRDTWQRWLDIANRYKTQEEADAADREAGRAAKAPQPMADLEPLPLAALPPGYSESHINSNEQASA